MFFNCGIIMTTTPSTRFSKMNWPNFHHNHCSKLAKNTFEAIVIGDSIVAGLSRYQNVWEKFLKPLKAFNCGAGGDRIQHVFWRALNLPVFSDLKMIYNLLLVSPKDIADGILKIARSFKTNYSCINVVICGILPRDDSWSVNLVSIKEVNQILKLKCYESSHTFVSYDSGWTLSNSSLNADLHYSDRLHLVEKGDLKLAGSIFNSIEVSNDFICCNHNNKFSKSYKMAVSFKLNNSDFPPLPLPSASKPVSSISSLPFNTARKPFPRNINIWSFAIATNTPTSSVPCILQDSFFS